MVADVGGFLSFSILSIRSRSLSLLLPHTLFWPSSASRCWSARTHANKHTYTHTHTHASVLEGYISFFFFCCFLRSKREKKGRREMRRYLPSSFPIPTRQFYQTDAIVRIDLSNPSICLFYFQVTILWTPNRMRERERAGASFPARCFLVDDDVQVKLASLAVIYDDVFPRSETCASSLSLSSFTNKKNIIVVSFR